DADARRVRLEQLPLRGGGVLDVAAATPLVKSLLGGSVKTVTSTGPPRVLVEDGSGLKGTAAQRLRDRAAAKLLGGGFRYANGGDAEKGAAKTTVQVPEGDTAKSNGIQVA